MHPDLVKLIILQEQDLEARRLREEITSLPKRIAELDSKAKNTAAQRALVFDLLAKEEAQRRRYESDVKDQQQKIDRTTHKLDLVTTPAQATALEHEIAFARTEITRLEDAELESMERADGLESQCKLADSALADATAVHQRESARATETIARDKVALAEVDGKRQALRSDILSSPTGDGSLAAYDRIAHAKGTAVSEALNQKCTACQMMIRPQRWNDIRDNSAQSPSNQSIMTCDNCGRLLFYDPARDAPQRKAVESESIAAYIVRSM